MENMEILGVFYIPKDGFEKALPVIAANAVMGWYDALRFASDSGRTEISSNEGFFKKALVIAGPEVAKSASDFFKNYPERTARLVEQGLAIAERWKNTATYDRRWPTAYGLEHTICAEKGPCETVKFLPTDQWGNAWDQAKKRVISYYGEP